MCQTNAPIINKSRGSVLLHTSPVIGTELPAQASWPRGWGHVFATEEGLFYFFKRDAECFCHSLAVGRVGLQAVTDVADLDEFGSIAHSPGSVLE